MKNRLIHPKVSKFTAIGGAVSVLVVGALGRIHGLDLTAAESGAVAAIITWAFGLIPVRG